MQYKAFLSNCNVVDVVTGAVLENQCIAIGTDGTIAKIFDDDDNSHNKDEFNKTALQTLDCQGGYVIPGLIDCHVHITAFTGNFAELERTSPSYVTARAILELQATLRRGVTTIRDAGGADHGLARALQEGHIQGPRLLFCGKALSQTGGHGDMRAPGDFAKAFDCTCAGLGRVCDGDAQVRRATRDEIRKGATHIKVMAGGGVASPTDRITSTQFSLMELCAIVEEATAANIHVMAHAYTPRAIINSVKAGIKSIEHGNLIDQEAAQFMAKHGTYLVPTLATYDALAKEGIKNGLSQDMIAKVDNVLDAGKRAIRIAQEGGVTMCYGSDLLADMRQYQLTGLGLLEESGMAPLHVLQSATINAAKLTGLDDEIGTVQVGKVADLVVLKKNPLQSSMRTVFGDWEENYLAVFRAGQQVELLP